MIQMLHTCRNNGGVMRNKYLLTGIFLLHFLFTFAQGQRVVLSVSENKPIGTPVGSLPTPQSGHTYELSSTNRFFTLQPAGTITTKAAIDRESLPSDIIDLLVFTKSPSDGGSVPLEVRINILDKNDNNPTFPRPEITIPFSETAGVGDSVILQTATDPDKGTNSISPNYKIVSGNDGNIFKLLVTSNLSTPFLYLQNLKKLDRETKPFYQLNISAQDGGTPPRFGYLMVNVTVTDFNEFAPDFDKKAYIVNVNESATSGSFVAKITAMDRDAGANADVIYSLANDDYNQFTINRDTGVITTRTHPLRCMRVCARNIFNCNPNTCIIKVIASDNGQPSLSSQVYVTIMMIDENDHVPKITFRYTGGGSRAAVDESAVDGHTVVSVTVSDLDTGENGRSTLKITRGNELGHFRLITIFDSFNLIQVNGTGKTDREKIPKYNLTVVATDHGKPPLSSTSFLIVHVNDVNDHTPVFKQTEYLRTLDELTPIGTFVAGITATDNDTDENARITYTIVSGDDYNWFNIDPSSGLVITRKVIDREITDSVVLNISAQDGGTIRRSAFVRLSVTIKDENDQVPTFQNSTFSVTLMEEESPPKHVITASATDNDLEQNGTVYYSLSSDVETKYPGTFQLNSNTGRIDVIKKLDREQVSKYDIKLSASDRGKPALSSTCTIQLLVGDKNDNSPIFYPTNYYNSVNDSLSAGTKVIQVTATDGDAKSNGIVTYSITSGSDAKFSIGAQSGIISTAQQLNAAQKSLYRLTVAAKDNGNNQAHSPAVVEISVANSQNMPPVFSQPQGYSFSITEDGDNSVPSLGRIVGTVTASRGGNSYRYAITGGDFKQIFSINSNTGVITNVKKIDREIESFYSLTVVASSSLSFGIAAVNVTIGDINDVTPTFTLSSTTVDVSENWPIGHEVYHAIAIDNDEGPNAQLTYTLSMEPQTFTINDTTGVIRLNKPVQYGQTFYANVTVSDSGTPSKSSKVYLKIVVKDVNDHTPSFTMRDYEISILESLPLNDRFYKFTATDADAGSNSAITYSIVKGNEERKFGIFPDGEIYIHQTLDRETRDKYQLLVRAIDGGKPPRNSNASVTIYVIDANDNRPQFANVTYDFYIPENSSPYTTVGILRASDDDKGRNGQITFSISRDDDYFTINPRTGEIQTLEVIDREKLIKSYGSDILTFEAVVTDNGIKKLNDKATVKIHVTDENDSPPVFSKKMYEAVLYEKDPINTPVKKVSAVDLDDGPNGITFYSIIGGDENNTFEIRPDSGQIILKGVLDREKQDSYMLRVTARDIGNLAHKTSTASVHVSILDNNDNKPLFISPLREESIPESTSAGELITQFSTMDYDEGVNAKVSYVISSGNSMQMFSMDSASGKLYLGKKLDYERSKLYNLSVVAADKGNPTLSSTTYFSINVLDDNDNAPVWSNDDVIKHINENLPVNTPVEKMVATDADSGVNKAIRYSIVYQEPSNNHFDIHPTSGQIFIKTRIDREKTSSFTLRVRATDQAIQESKRHFSEKTVAIVIDDLNDNTPKFVSVNAATVLNSSRRNALVTVVKAMDPDSNNNALVAYSVTGGLDSSLFTINSVTGSLSLASDLTSGRPVFKVIITATDKGSNPRSSTLDLTVIAKSTTNAGPAFNQSSYTGTIVENKPAGTWVSTVFAAYNGRSSQIEYFITGITSSGEAQHRYFQIGQSSGRITTTQPMDRENLIESFTLDVYAVDMASSTLQTQRAQVTINLQDENDTPPRFTRGMFYSSVSENVTVGTRVQVVLATDPDKTGTLRYGFQSGNDGTFNIDRQGVITLARRLDREEKPSYELKVSVTDGVQTSYTQVLVTVQDINDSPPVFSQAGHYTFDIREDTTVGTMLGKVSATDGDERTNAVITYSILSSWGSDVFDLDSKTGIFTLKAQLDFEKVPHYILQVHASNTGQTAALSSTSTVYMNVKDVNDNTPIFEQVTYNSEILEDAAVGSSVVSVEATDRDSGTNGQVEYSILTGDPEHQFSVIPSNGTIVVAKPLDRELQAFYTLTVTATDRTLPPNMRLRTTCKVAIIVKDINDQEPVFWTPNVTWVYENAPIDSLVMTVSASDTDEGRNRIVEYSMAPVAGNPLEINPANGQLKVKNGIDRETIANYTLLITATDKGVPALSATQSLLVNVRDRNDNSPEFTTKQYSKVVSENVAVGTPIVKVGAKDRDEGVNGKAQYFIVGGDPNRDFMVEQESGQVKVNKKLDFERESNYQLLIQAEDGGKDSRTDTATVSIALADINDNTPLFLHSPYTAYVQENVASLPVHILLVSAFDADSASYNKVQYSIQQGDQSIFSIERQTGEVKAKRALDREKEDEYHLVVLAEDSGTNPQLTGTGTVTIYVKDQNDHSPVFEQNSYIGSIAENLGPDTPIVRVKATDGDTASNALVRYYLEDSAGNKFTVNPSSGLILTTSRLDREQQDEYHLTVVAQDGGSTPRSSTASVTVFISDKNDNAPIFQTSQYMVYIRDPTSAGDFVLGVTAIDNDIGSNGKILYSLAGADSSNFRIDQLSGIITANARLSQRQQYNFQVTAYDLGQPRRSSVTNVKLIALTASPTVYPTISQGTRSFNFVELTRLGTTVETISATSPKSGAASRISYYIAGGNVGRAFSVDRSAGRIYISGWLDYETIKQYDLVVEARDSDTPPLSTYTRFTIVVKDVNDNKPRFGQLLYRKSIMEELPSYTPVITVSATDDDSSLSGQVLYRIVGGNTGNAFSMATNSGLIQTAVQLDRETLDHYSLVVEAVDKGSPRQTSTASVDITVLDKNDNNPKFTDQFFIQIPESLSVGSFVIKITSSDKDIGPNAIAYYSLLSNPGNKFAIDRLSGNLTVAGPLDRETQGRYQLSVRAEDGSFVVQTSVDIVIGDVNDNKPKFILDSFTFNLPEYKPKLTIVGQVKATDKDEQGPNSEVIYQLKSPSDTFTINPNSGKISSLKELVYHPNQNNRYQLIVKATDKGQPSQMSESTVIINIIDFNNNPPIFEKTSYFSAVPENAVSQRNVIQVIARDTKDYGINADVRYSLTGGNGSSLFDVKFDSGWIFVKGSLSGQKGKEFIVTIKAQDRGNIPLSSAMNVHLRVTDVNHHAPQFSGNDLNALLRENTDVNTVVTTMSATDSDIGMNGQVSYYITSGNNGSLFAIGEKSGILTVAKPLDYDTQPVHRLGITARDRGLLYREQTVTFTVTLQDVNDNSPIFSQDMYDAYAAENIQIGTSIFRARATDADSPPNDNIEYTIANSEAINRMFSVNKRTGVISTEGDLDYEQVKQYDIIVLATNPHSTQGERTTIRVHVVGRNEFVPRFQKKQYTFTVSESTQVDTPIGYVLAADEDDGIDGDVLYFLIEDSNNRGFKVDKISGAIKVATRLDRESSSHVMLNILAKNHGSITGNDTDRCTVRINLQDANDAPVFSKAVYTAHVPEMASIDTSVKTVTATDSDLRADYNKFSYKVHGPSNPGGSFKINPQSGLITVNVNRQLDRERTPVYNLIVLAEDNGSPPETGTATVRIQLDDINDNGPMWNSQFTANVTENVQPPTNIINLYQYTTDPDVSPNQDPYTYTLLSGLHSNKFQVGRTSGMLQAVERLDRENTTQYNLSLRVQDGGSPTQSSTLIVTVNVLDIRDTPATARPLKVNTFTFNGNLKGGDIANVRPNDLDLSGQYTCSLVTGDQKFSISNGCMLKNSALTASGDQTYSLNVSGKDNNLLKPVYYKVDVHVKDITNATLDNSINIRLKTITIDEFVKNSYIKFLKVIEDLYNNRETVIIYSVMKSANNIDLMLAVRQENGQYVNAAAVATKISSMKSTIENHANVRFLSNTIDYKICSASLCHNGGTCTDSVILTDDRNIIDSPSLVLTFATTKRSIKCNCLPEFSGPTCNGPNTGPITCTSSTCKNGGTCSGIPYSCSCPAGYTGRHCETVVAPCGAQRCQNGGVCETKNGAPSCKCGLGEYGQYCQNMSHGFKSLSYMEFQSVQSDGNSILIDFATTSQNALLMYQPSGMQQFMALEIVEGQLKFSFDLGEQTTVLTVPKIVSDGKWYSVQAIRVQKQGQLQVDDCVAGTTPATCTKCQSTDSNCFISGAKGQSPLTTPSSLTMAPLDVLLNVNNLSFTLGGVKNMDHITNYPGQVVTHDFIGCMRTAKIDGRNLFGSEANVLSSKNITMNSCPRQNGPLCGATTCGGNGQCFDEWFGYRCQCYKGFSGMTCNKEIRRGFSFGPNAIVRYIVKESYKRQQQLSSFTARKRRAVPQSSHSISIRFRTTQDFGVLFYSSSTDGYSLIQLNQGKLTYSFKKNNFNGSLSIPVKANSGSWKNASLVLTGTRLKLQEIIDGNSNENTFPDVHDFLGFGVNELSLGGVNGGLVDGKQIKGFNGCMSDFLVDGQDQPFNGLSERFLIEPSSDTQSECEAVTCSVLDCKTDQKCEDKGGVLACVTSSPDDPSSTVVIIIVVFVCAIIIAIVIIIVIIRFRRNKKEKEANHRVKQSNGSYLIDKPSDRGIHKSGYTESGVDEPDDIIISNHIQRELANMEYEEREISDRRMGHPPDIIDPESHSRASNHSGIQGIDNPALLLDNGDLLDGLNDSNYPEHYDIENASSIAPSDIDVIKHYRGYREGKKYQPAKHHGGNYHHKHQHKHAPNPLLARPQRESPLNVQRQSPNGMLRGSPNLLAMQGVGMVRNSPMTVTHNHRQSPLSHGTRQSPMTVNSALSRASPYGIPMANMSRASPIKEVNSGSNTDHSHNDSFSASDTSMGPNRRNVHSPRVISVHIPNNHNNSHLLRPNSKLKSPLNGMRNSPPHGLTIEEIDRLNARQRESMVSNDAISSNNEQENNDANLIDANALLEPPDSSSDDGSNDSFTCSEFEDDNIKVRNDFDPVFSKIPEDQSVTNDDVETIPESLPLQHSNFIGSWSTLMASDDDSTIPRHHGKHHPSANLNWDYLLNWGPSFEKLVGVFKDIAQLPDSEDSSVVINNKINLKREIAVEQTNDNRDEEYV